MGGAAIRNGAEVAGGEEQPPVSKLQRVKNYFFDQGLELKDLPTAFVYHEVVGLAMAAGFWSGCYLLQPSRHVVRFAAGGRAAAPGVRRSPTMLSASARAGTVSAYRTPSGNWDKMLGMAEKNVASWTWLQKVPVAKKNPQRFTVSLAESLTLRGFIKPVTFPFKLWASWQLTIGTKRALARLPVGKKGPLTPAAEQK